MYGWEWLVVVVMVVFMVFLLQILREDLQWTPGVGEDGSSVQRRLPHRLLLQRSDSASLAHCYQGMQGVASGGEAVHLSQCC